MCSQQEAVRCRLAPEGTKCGHELEQTIGNLKLSEHMRCPGCGVGIDIDTNRLANAAKEIQRAMDKIPREITIKFFR